MCKLSFYLILVVMCGCALRAAAAPRHDRHKKHAVHGHLKKRNSESSKEQFTIDLPDVLNKTVCPIQQVVDDDPFRIPRRIKMLKCAPTPSQVCQQADIRAEQACCGQKHEKFNTQCVEVRDHVVVSDLSGAEPRLRTIEVSVGCTCMIRRTRPASEDD